MIRKKLIALVNENIAENFVEPDSVKDKLSRARRAEADKPHVSHLFAPVGAVGLAAFVAPVWSGFHESPYDIADEDFDKIFASKADETFSEMLLRLIGLSGEKPSAIYKRADIDRQIFSRIRQNKNYQPSKDTVISFAFALKLDLPTTKKLLNTAGYALTNSSKRDIIISTFIEHKEFRLRKLNEILYGYGQPVLLKR